MTSPLVKWGLPILILLVVFICGLSYAMKNPVSADKVVVSTDVFAEASNLRKHVYSIAGSDHFRNVENLARLNEVAAYIHDELRSYGIEPEIRSYDVQGTAFKNIVVRLATDKKEPMLVLGAHYDVCFETPGADDNASGVAGLLEIARVLKKNEAFLIRPVELAFYTLEEPPYFATEHMGSVQHAKQLKEANANIALMISVEMIGRFSDEPIQKYPNPLLSLLYPAEANFIAMIGRMTEYSVMKKVKGLMLGLSEVPVESINAPIMIPGIDDSDHRSFWAEGYQAIMVTDTAYLRNLDYHTLEDTPDKINYPEMAKVVTALAGLVLKF